jgi:transcription-repair coupling factor (superfamily II helicase)
MLGEAVAELKGEAPQARVEPTLELRLSAHLPAAWVDDPALRFSVLRKIAAARDAGALADVRRELIDRFGQPPAEAARLLDLAELKTVCRAAGVARIEEIADRRYRCFLTRRRLPRRRARGAAAQSARRVALPGAGFTWTAPSARAGDPAGLGRLLALATGAKT